MSTDTAIEQISPNTEQLIHGFSGALGGVITTVLLYPIDNIKTKMQVSGEHAEQKKSFMQILNETSFLELYDGLSPDVVGNFISNGIYFFTYEKAKKHFDMSSFTGYVYAATIASGITTFWTNPFRVLNTKMIVKQNNEESSGKQNQTVWELSSQIYRKNGIPGFFSGLGSSLVLCINPIINYVIYEKFKLHFKDSTRKTLMFFISGAISKAIATFFTYPVQVVRTNIMLKKEPINEIVKRIYKTKGLGGFLKGLPPKLIQSVINSAIMLFLYEKIFAANRLVFLLIVKKLAKH